MMLPHFEDEQVRIGEENRYRITDRGDGTVDIVFTGQVERPGTPINKATLNPMVDKINELESRTEGLEEATLQQVHDLQVNFIDLSIEFETLKGATLNGVTANIFVETFQTLNDIEMIHGSFDVTNEKVYLP
ncbi:hypothetical protein LOK74_18955 [Brevibacillus humidisoli]|uniref:hypothetical protein n=1 Tax=Brevibacillus humidisoli TaxID=2895522 RepID=UPI001E36B355|nr:hypothetical protein [Brevibacillus humidisoli]UFJ40093.1 hypothetical protein LOK74_18955 [Brevibacillus humidisoli]